MAANATPQRTSAWREIARGILETTAGQWIMILSLIFGGCCSNAWTLELATSQNPRAGSLITFAQFVLVTLFGIRKRFVSNATKDGKTHAARPSLSARVRSIRLRPLAVPISRWLIQVVLFLGVSYLNNAAFKYKIPMAVHIVFRSGGLVINMILAYITMGRTYPRLQVLSILLISFGITAATMSATKPSSLSASSSFRGPTVPELALGISLLFVALVLSALLGFSQEKTYAKYGRGHWEEGMFFLHFLALPMFAFVGGDLAEQVRFANSTPRIPVGAPVYALLDTAGFSPSSLTLSSLPWPSWIPKPDLPPLMSLTVPSFWIPLVLNVLTQLVCVSGVNRLTSRVSSLTVTLVLALRKAVSLVISVVLIGQSRGNSQLWLGSGAVLLGTVMYTLGNSKTPSKDKKTE